MLVLYNCQYLTQLLIYVQCVTKISSKLVLWEFSGILIPENPQKTLLQFFDYEYNFVNRTTHN